MEANERKVPILRSENSLIDQEFDSIREKFEVEMSKMEEEMSRFRSQLIASERDRLVSTLSSTMSSSASSSSSRSTTIKGAQQQQQQQLERDSGNNQVSETLTKQQQKQTLSSSSMSKSSSTQSASSTSTSKSQQHQQQANKPLNPAQGAPQGSTSERFVVDSSSINWLNEMNSPLIKESDKGQMLRLRFDVNAYEPEQIIVKTVDNRLQIHAKREEKSENMSVYREYNREFLLPEGTDPELIRSSLSADGVLTVEAPLPVLQAQTAASLGP